jgi:hypothetical protein
MLILTRLHVSAGNHPSSGHSVLHKCKLGYNCDISYIFIKQSGLKMTGNHGLIYIV